jgi:pimeloyl-ACP methyl ester carboxylesterase
MQQRLHSASKQAIEVPTKWQVLDVASTGIRGNVISPEITDRAMLTRSTKAADRLVKGVPPKRRASTQSINNPNSRNIMKIKSILNRSIATLVPVSLAGAPGILASDAGQSPKPTVVLVHGGFVDGSGWQSVYKILKKDGYQVSIVQNSTISLEDDVAVTKRVLAAQDGPVILVGHSYGGAVITEAGNDPKVAGLVYIAAFALDDGESVSSLIKDPPPGAPVPPILPPQDGFLLLDKAKFPDSFAADVDPKRAAFLADSQVPWGVGALSGTVTKAAWKTKPSWYLITTQDKMLPPPAQQFMSKRAGSKVVEVAGSHAIYESQPKAVTKLIETAAKEVTKSPHE